MTRIVAFMLLLLSFPALAGSHEATTDHATALKCASPDKRNACRVRCFVYWPDGKEQKVLDTNDVSRVSLNPLEEGSVLLEIRHSEGDPEAFLANANTVCEFRGLGR